ncbi:MULTISPECIES: type II toxin-antitoxin system YhaV family toxin [Gammaproteobacteria]|jgi:toxin YhaV|uniref:Type II toxin-antitoxin system YhaV family toxin n=1 Tax=Coralloluteibacterium thermophilum TaxID=2707049 RepID=A0ABV9NMC1_9GAMM|nr:type II toxin-antitoxin system YhaV family toxin [Pseudomonas guguanensis]MCW5592181.1 type II toxin-antitoxin system YhaV family toxin [Burkholderiales bacterium]WJH55999.1 type II toxin-antitoxin system YhaV family toxin [Pseudomonas guguanensis]
MQRHGWTLLFHECVVEQLRKLHAAAQRAEQNDPEGFESNANVKLFRALSQLMLETVPTDPARDEYRQGNTLGPAHRHWRRAKIGRRFRLFFRYDSKAKVIVYAWVNDETTLRSSGSKSDPYAVFEKMLGRGNPPDDWNALVAASRQEWSKLE